MFRKTTCTLLLCLALPITAHALDRPASAQGVEVAQSTVKWTWSAVPGATSYEVFVDGRSRGTTTDTSFTSTNLYPGEHSAHVRAKGADSDYSAISPTAKVSVGSSATPAAQQDDEPLNRAFSSSDDPTLIDPATAGMPDATSKPNYNLVFSDEFNGSSLNSYRWNTQLRWDGEFNGERFEYRVINGEDQFYVNKLSDDPAHADVVGGAHNPFEFDGQRLAIRAVKNPLKKNTGSKRFGPLKEIVEQQEFLSGAISTYDKFTQKYGYFEARIKIPKHDGTFPAFWLHHQKRSYEGTYKSEIDIMENLGHAPQYIYNSFHYFTDVSRGFNGNPHFLKPKPQGQIYTGLEYSEDFHVYAVEWEPNRIIWYIDGQQVSELNSQHVNYEELYLIINLAMGGNWTNFGTNSGGLGRPSGQEFPNSNDLATFGNPALEIDYVRVYARN